MKARFVLVLILGFAITRGSAVAADSGHGTNPVTETALAAENAIKSFKLHDPSLRVELFASEPLLANGVAFTEDNKGRWYIAETYRQEKGIEDNRAHGNWLSTDLASRTVEDRLAMIRKFYPDEATFREKFTKYEERITTVEDSDGDAKADKSTIFADGFRDPLDGTGAGILARNSEVWWTCIPHLWHFRDNDGDGKADIQETLLGGFGVHYAFRGHDMHGLRFGPDGKLYFTIGDRGLHVVTKEGQTIAEPDTGSVLRCDPDGRNFEVFATGVRNPQELAFDAFGNLFTGDNNSDSGDKARFVYLVEGGDSGWRMQYQYLNDRGPWNRERIWDAAQPIKNRYIIPPVANIGAGPAGLTYNPGTALSEKHRDRFYMSDFRGGASASVVHQIALAPKGAFFQVKEQRDFVTGVLTSDVEFGRDGSLFVLDWVESWRGSGKGRIYKFTDPAGDTALQEQTKKLIEEGMSQRPPQELLALLAHADMRIRQAAQFELADRGPKSAPLFASIAQGNATLLARLHAIWGMGQLAAKSPAVLENLAPLLQDPESEVRAQTAKVLGDHRVASSGDRLTTLLADKESRVRFFASVALGKIRHHSAVDALCQMLKENNDEDPVLRHGGVMGLAGVATAEQLAAKADDSSAAVRAGALLALRRQKDPKVARFLSDSDPTLVLEAARAIHDVPIEGAMPALAKMISDSSKAERNLSSRVVNANFRLGTAENAQALAAYAANSSIPNGARKDALDALASWGNPPARDRVLNMWRPLPDRSAGDAIAAITPVFPELVNRSPASVQEVAAKVAAKLSLPDAGEPLFQLASNDKASTGARIAALQALASLRDRHLPQVAKIAVADKDPKVRTEGLQALAGADPAAAVKVIGDIVVNAGTAEKQGAILALSQIQKPEANALLQALMDKLIAGAVPPEIRLDVYEAARRADTPELKEKLAAYNQSHPAGDKLAPFRIALAGGDVDRGRKIFRDKVEVQCLRCHRSEIGDSQVGPDLTHIGATRDRQYLLESILFPNEKIAPGFQIVSLTLENGSMVVGRLLREDADGLHVEGMNEQGKLVTTAVPLAQVKNRFGAPSAMPSGLGEFLSKGELRDLVEYLASPK